MTSEPKLKFLSESIKPVKGTMDSKAMATGGPGLPGEFTWNGTALSISSVIRTWREMGPCRHGGSETYVRKHWFEVETTLNQRANIYFERQPRDRNHKKRWWLYSIEEEG